jgi:hypothetical protein
MWLYVLFVLLLISLESRVARWTLAVMLVAFRLIRRVRADRPTWVISGLSVDGLPGQRRRD